MFRRWFFALLAGLTLTSGCMQPQTRLQSADDPDRSDREAGEIRTIGDISTMAGLDPVPVAGIGLVTGLDGTGGGVPPGPERIALEEAMKKRGVQNIKELFNSKTTALVRVAAYVPAGTRKGETVDVYVTVPETSRATSLRGGSLDECLLYNYASSNAISTVAGNPIGGRADATIRGHAWVKADGAILAGIRPDADPDDPPSSKSGVIWGGGKCLMPDRTFTLYLNPDQQYARVAGRIAERINETFHAPGLAAGNGEFAHAVSKNSVTLNVPGAYRLNMARYLRVVRLIPLNELPAPDSAYAQKLAGQLLDPATTITAALRLEALGAQSVSALKVGLHSDLPLVRFAAAESLAYLGSPSCGEELGKQVAEQPFVQAFALTALASLNEAVCRVKLEELLHAASPETRFGAFQALRARDERDSLIQGEKIGAFWLHQAARSSSPQVHYSTAKRAEIVLFGDTPQLVAPFSILAGPEFVIRAKEGDATCTVCRITAHKGKQTKTCSLELADVLRTVAGLGGNYADAIDLLRQAESCHGLNCALKVDALPKAPTVYDLARAGVQLAGGRSDNLAAVSAEIGVTPTLYERAATPKPSDE
jgi:Flagellar P-ring protein